MAQNAFSDAAEQEAPDPPSSVTSHDDEISRPVLRAFDDLGSRLSELKEFQSGWAFRRTLPEGVEETPSIPLRNRSQHVYWHAAVWCGNSRGINRMEKGQVRLQRFRELDTDIGRLCGKCTLVKGDQYSLEAHSQSFDDLKRKRECQP